MRVTPVLTPTAPAGGETSVRLKRTWTFGAGVNVAPGLPNRQPGLLLIFGSLWILFSRDSGKGNTIETKERPAMTRNGGGGGGARTRSTETARRRRLSGVATTGAATTDRRVGPASKATEGRAGALRPLGGNRARVGSSLVLKQVPF